VSKAQQIIDRLQLQPHPKEGGFFRETYRSAYAFSSSAMPVRYGADRSAGTAIYYLLTPETFSAMHRLKTDEIFHFYAGDPVRMLQLLPDGRGKEVIIGSDVLAGHEPQVVVPSGVWQGSCLVEGGEYALLGCTVAPGFDYGDYEHGSRESLIEQHMNFEKLITRLTTTHG